MTLGDIIKEYRSQHGMSMDDFSQRSGISKAYISLLEKNRHPRTGMPIIPSVGTISKAAIGMGMDFNDLFFMIDGNVDVSPLAALEAQADIRPVDTRRFPVLGSVACGKPIYMNEEKEVYFDSASTIDADFILVAKGHSMINARINDGDIVFVRKQEYVENGEIAVVAIDDEATLKRFYRYDGVIVLRAENPEYKDIEIRPGDQKEVRILGKAVAFQSNII